MYKIKLTIFCVIFSATAALYAQERGIEEIIPSASVETVRGTIDIQREGESAWTSLKIGDTINPLDQIVIGHDGKLTIKHGENLIELSGRTLFSLKEIAEKTTMDLWRGRLRAQIKELGASVIFEVHTPVAVCAVRGTDFEVLAGDSKTKLKTYDGSVAFKNIQTGDEVLVKAGMQSVIEAGKAPAVPETITEPEKEPELPDTEQETEIPQEEETVIQKTDREEKKSRPKAAAAPATGFNIDGTLGADVMSDPENPDQQKIYYNLSLMPEFSLYKFGVGLDIRIYFDENGNIKQEEWDDWSDVLDKLLYVRYGMKSDPVYIYAGGIKTYTLGTGIIVNRYSNMLSYPEVRNIGVNAKFDLGRGGFETFISDIDRYPLTGARIFYRPFYFTGLPVLKSWQLGVQGAADFNPDMRDFTDKDEVVFYGADTIIPLLDIPVISADLHGGYASYTAGSSYNIDQPGQGLSVGVKGRVIAFISYGIDYQRVDNNFATGYFDRYYEVARSARPDLLEGPKLPVKEGPKFQLGFNLPDMVNLKMEYENYNIDHAGRYPYLHGELNIEPALLLNKYSLGIYYDKQGVNSFNDIIELPGAIMTIEVGYNIAPNVTMVIVQKQSFDESGDAEKTISMRTRFSF